MTPYERGYAAALKAAAEVCDEMKKGAKDERRTAYFLAGAAIRSLPIQGEAEGSGPCVSVPVAKLLAIRDALLHTESLVAVNGAYHELYTAVAWRDPFKPWAEWEAMLAAAKEE